MSPKEAPQVHQGVMDSLSQLQRFMRWAHFYPDLEQSRTLFAEFEAKSLRGEELHLMGFDLTGTFLFCCSIVPSSRLNPFAFEIGYWVCSPIAGKDLGTIAAKIATYLAFSQYQANRVAVFCHPENLGSLRIIEKLGFRFEGQLRNHLIQPTQEIVANGYAPSTDAKAIFDHPRRSPLPSLV